MNALLQRRTVSRSTPEFAIKGLTCAPNFITKEEETRLLNTIDCQAWSTELKRRVQHYGYRYDYKARMIHDDSYLGPLPDWMGFLIRRLRNYGIFSEPANQAIINEYQPGQGIAAHVDCIPCFTDTIASLSLTSDCQMEFSHPESRRKMTMTLPRSSLLILQEDARYRWRHSIPPRKSDVVDGERIARQRRVSITFRRVIRSRVS